MDGYEYNSKQEAKYKAPKEWLKSGQDEVLWDNSSRPATRIPPGLFTHSRVRGPGADADADPSHHHIASFDNHYNRLGIHHLLVKTSRFGVF